MGGFLSQLSILMKKIIHPLMWIKCSTLKMNTQQHVAREHSKLYVCILWYKHPYGTVMNTKFTLSAFPQVLNSGHCMLMVLCTKWTPLKQTTGTSTPRKTSGRQKSKRRKKQPSSKLQSSHWKRQENTCPYIVVYLAAHLFYLVSNLDSPRPALLLDNVRQPP